MSKDYRFIKDDDDEMEHWDEPASNHQNKQIKKLSKSKILRNTRGAKSLSVVRHIKHGIFNEKH